MHTLWKDEAKKWAIAEEPREACGLIVLLGEVETYVPCKNLADEDDYFVLDPSDYAAAEDKGAVLAVFHSHPSGRSDPSPNDIKACNLSKLPWWIYSVKSQAWSYLEPEDEPQEQER